MLVSCGWKEKSVAGRKREIMRKEVAAREREGKNKKSKKTMS